MVLAILLLPVSTPAAAQQLISSPGNLGFGTVTVGQAATSLVVLYNSGQTSVTISTVSVSGSEFTVSGLSLPVTVAAGQGAAMNVQFSPTATGWVGGKILVTSNASNAYLRLPLAGAGVTAEALTATPPSLSFGSVTVGGTATLPVVLTNARSTKETLTAFKTIGSQFTVSGPGLPATVGPGQSVTVNVTFTPQTAGLSGGTLLVGGPALNVPLVATGTTPTVGQLTISPTALSFGSVEVGTTTTETPTLSAVGGSVTISSAASSNAQFAIAGASFPMTISAGQSVPVKVTFTPANGGAAAASLSFMNNGSSNKMVEGATGTGTMPYVSLSWSPSTSGVAGYNIYRGTAPGSYSKVNTSLNSTTAFTDSKVAPGTTYYYAATAVGSNGQESAPSTPIQVSIP